MNRLLCGVGLFFAIVETLPAAPVPAAQNDPTKDREGNPLPKGALARLGSLCYRGPTTTGLTFSADGKRLYALRYERSASTVLRKNLDLDAKPMSVPRDGKMLIWDTENGRLLTTRSFEPAVDDNSMTSSCVAGNRIITITRERPTVRRNEESTVKVMVAAVEDGREITHFDFPGSSRLLFSQEYEFEETGLGSATSMVTVSPNGKNMALITSRDNSVMVFDLNSGKLLHSHKIETFPSSAVYITPDSKTLFVCEESKPLVRYDLVSGKALPAIAETEVLMRSIVVSEDGKRAITRGYSEINDGAQRPINRKKNDDFLVVRDAETGKSSGRLAIGGAVHAFQFAGPDAALVTYTITGTGIGGSHSYVSRWNLATLKREWEKPIQSGIVASPLKVSPDGKLFTLAGSHAIVLCSTQTGQPINPIAAHMGSVQWIGFSSDGKTVTTAGGGDLLVWATNGERKRLIEMAELGQNWNRIPMGLSGNHLAWLASSEDGKATELIGWDHDKSQVAWRMPLPGKQPANIFSHDGKRVVVLNWEEKWEDWQASVYDGPTGKMIDDWTVPYLAPKTTQLDNPIGQLNPNGVNGVGGGQAWPPGGIPAGGKGGAGGAKGQPKGLPKGGGGPGGGFPGFPDEMPVRLAEQRIKSGPSWIHPIALSGDGNTIFVAGSRIIGLDAIRGKKMTRLDSGLIASIAASRQGPLAASTDGSLLAVGDQRSLRIYNVKTEKLAREFAGTFQYAQMKFSPASESLVVWSNSGTAVLLYRLDSDQAPRTFDGGLSVPTCAAFNASGTNLAVGYLDGTSLIWDLTAK